MIISISVTVAQQLTNLFDIRYLPCSALLYFEVWEIWGSIITGQLLVIICTFKWKWRLWDNENDTKVLCMIRSIWLAEQWHNRLYHIIRWLTCYPKMPRNITWHISRGEQVSDLALMRVRTLENILANRGDKDVILKKLCHIQCITFLKQTKAI